MIQKISHSTPAPWRSASDLIGVFAAKEPIGDPPMLSCAPCISWRTFAFLSSYRGSISLPLASPLLLGRGEDQGEESHRGYICRKRSHNSQRRFSEALPFAFLASYRGSISLPLTSPLLPGRGEGQGEESLSPL